MIELFKHILHLDFEWLFSNYGTFVYLILFLVIFIETGIVVMPFLPGDSLLFTAGLFAQLGYLDIKLLIVLLFIAAVAGDNTNYFIGRNIGLKIMQYKIKGRRIIKEEYIDKTHNFYERYGKKTVIMARFVPIVRTLAPFIAGVAEMKYRTFLLFDLMGGAIWILSLTLAGYFLGHFDIIRKNIEIVAILIIVLSLMPVIIEVFRNKKNSVSGK